MKRARFGFSKSVQAIGWTSLLNDASSEMIFPLLPVFLTSVLGVGPAFLGLIEGIADGAASVVKLWSGWLSDRLGHRKRLMFAGYAMATVARPFLAVSVAAWQVLVVRFVDRAGKGIRGAPRDALLAASSPADEQGKAFGFQRSMDHAGAVIGPLAASLLVALTHGKYRLIFALAAIPGILTLPVILWGVEEKKLPRDGRSRPLTLALSPFSGRFRAFLGVVTLFTLGNSSDAFILLRARTLGVSVALLPILWVALHVVKSASSIPAGIVSDHMGRRRVIAAGWCIFGLIYLGFGVASKEWHIWSLTALYGLYFGLTEGVERAFVADLVPPELRGTAYGLYSFAVGVAALPASLLLGVIWQATGSALIAFGVGAALALVASVLLALIPEEPRSRASAAA